MRKILSIFFAIVIIFAIASFVSAAAPAEPDPFSSEEPMPERDAIPTPDPTTRRSPSQERFNVPRDHAARLQQAQRRRGQHDPRVTRQLNWRIIKGYLVAKDRRGINRFRPISGFYVAKPSRRGAGVIVQGRIYSNGRFLFSIPPDIRYNVWFYSRGFQIKRFKVKKNDLWDVFTVVLETGQRVERTIQNLDEPSCNECGDADSQENEWDNILTDPSRRACFGNCSYYHHEFSWRLKRYVIQFKFGSAVIERKFIPVLDEAAKRVKELLQDERDNNTHSFNVLVRGHADEIGNDLVNNTIAFRRAAAVKAYFIKKGIKKEKIWVASFGQSLPVGTCQSECERASNRRVDFKMLWRSKCYRRGEVIVEEDDAPTFETPYTRLRDEEIDEWRDRPRYYREDELPDRRYDRRARDLSGRRAARRYRHGGRFNDPEETGDESARQGRYDARGVAPTVIELDRGQFGTVD